ncbi:hypothetical protein [Paenibacillus xylanexedens]|uniref:hypothetical protein n=1 Tax=Paenibacillus xylanexedens TaxID=528191 RepID=UPI0011A2C0DA
MVRRSEYHDTSLTVVDDLSPCYTATANLRYGVFLRFGRVAAVLPVRQIINGDDEVDGDSA